MNSGPRWYSRVVPEPPAWNGYNQLINAKLATVRPWMQKMVITDSVTCMETPEPPLPIGTFGPGRLAVV